MFEKPKRSSFTFTYGATSVKYHLSTYSRADFQDLKRIMVVFLPLPIYWALFYQQNSTWVDQAGAMDTTIIWNTPGTWVEGTWPLPVAINQGPPPF